MVENRMVVDSEWRWNERISEPVMKEKGYHEYGTNKFVPGDEAYEYALERCLYGTEEERKEFKAMLVEWFYSGNWKKED